jgi:hypothetical protein
MAAETLSCPYCNSSVTVLRAEGSGQRLRCPRCHELIPYPGALEGALPPDYSAASNSGFESPSRRPWSNGAVALIILSSMATMALIGFAFAWFTTEMRRQRDHSTDPAAQSSSEVVSVAPSRLAGLGYLPAGTDAIAAIHVAELMDRPEIASLLQRIRGDGANFGINRLEQMTGLTLEELDHVVLGLKIEDDILGRIFLIVHTRRPYDTMKVRTALNAGRPVKFPNKTVYHIRPEQTELGGTLWCASARTLVFALQPKDLDSLPEEPITGIDRFPMQIQWLLSTMEEGTQTWVVGSASDWDAVLTLLQWFGLTSGDRQTLAQVRAFRGGLRCDKEILGQIEIVCNDEAGAEAADKNLAARGLDAGYLHKMAEEQPRTAALLGELAQSLVRERNGERVHANAKISLESVRQFLSRRSAGARAVN